MRWFRDLRFDISPRLGLGFCSPRLVKQLEGPGRANVNVGVLHHVRL